MKFKIIRLLFISLFLHSYGSFAQVHLGISAGLSSAWVTGNDARNVGGTVFSATQGLQAGLSSSFCINYFLQLRAELQYVQKGYSAAKTFDVYGTTSKLTDVWRFNTSYIESPVTLNYLTESEKIKFYIGVGPYIAYWVAGGTSGTFNDADLGGEFYKVKSVSETYAFDTEYGTNKRMDQRWDIGGTAQTGLAYKFTKGEIFIQARYNHGFVDILQFEENPPQTYSSQYNRNFGFTIGYMIPIGKKKEVMTDKPIEENQDEDNTDNQ